MNRKFTFTAVGVTSILLVFYSLILVNLLSNFLNFILGYDYDLVGVLIGALWLSSVAWAFIFPRLAIPSAGESSVTTKSLYKIDHIRTNVLQPISAQDWNHQSRAAISFFTGANTDQYLTAPTKKAASTLNPTETSITGQFTTQPATALSGPTDEVGKKASALVPASKSASTIPSSGASTPTETDSSIQSKPYVVINTSIPVPNLASAEVQAAFEAKILANKARQAKKAPPASNQS